jgi:hypothetical protein
MREKLGFNKYENIHFMNSQRCLGAREMSVVRQEVGNFLLKVPHLLVKAKYIFDVTRFSDRLVR